MTRQPENGTSAMMPSLEAKLRQLAAGLTPPDEAHLRAMHRDGGAGELSPSLRGKFQQCAATLTRDEATQLLLLSQFVGGDTNDTVGHRIALYEGDPGKKGRPQSGVPADAAGRDPASILTDPAKGLVMLLSPLAGFITNPF